MKSRLTHNLGLKILSVVLAALLWLTVMNTADPIVTETVTGIPVQIINDEVITSRGYRYGIESGETVDIRVKGKRTIVDNVSASDFVATADFNTLNSMYMASISVDCRTYSDSDLIVTLKNETMAVKLEEQVVQPYNVRIVTRGSVPENCYCYSAQGDFSLVQVTGSRSTIDKVKEVVAYVELDRADESFTKSCELEVLDENNVPVDKKKYSLSQDVLNVTVGICPVKTVDVVVYTDGKPADGYYVEDLDYAPSSAVIAADEAVLASVDRLVIPFDVSGAENTIDRHISLGDYLSGAFEGDVYAVGSNVDIAVVATVAAKTERVLELTPEDIDVRNIGEGLDYRFLSFDKGTVKVSGPRELVEEISVGELELYADLTGCGIGDYSKVLISGFDGELDVEAGAVMISVVSAQNESEGEGENGEQ